MDPHNFHREAEARSLAMHREVARRIVQQPDLLEPVRARVEAWLRAGPAAHPYAEAWRVILSGDPETIAIAIVDPSDHGRCLRQSTPFAGVLDARARWRILERAAAEAKR